MATTAKPHPTSPLATASPATAGPRTLRAAAGLPATPPPLGESALVIIDAQIEYTTGALALPHSPAAVQRIAELLTAARRLDRPVIHVVHDGPTGGLFDPAVGGPVIEDVAPEPGETIVHKRLPNSFAGTDLAEHVQTIDSPPLILAGFMTHMCVSSTARAALDLGMTTTVMADATATRALPNPSTGKSDSESANVSAEALQAAALAALADRFSIVTDTTSLLALS